MKEQKLRTHILFFFLAVIAFLGISMSVLGFYVVQKHIIGKAQDQVVSDLKTARSVYDKELQRMAASFALAVPVTDVAQFKNITGLDYFYTVPTSDSNGIPSNIVHAALKTGTPIGGTRLIERDELATLGKQFSDIARIEIKDTPKARQTTRKILDTAMVLEHAQPIVNRFGTVTAVAYGGKIINKNFSFIDSISQAVFKNEVHAGKQTGTVTIFLDDVRVVTTVLNSQGNRAVGTRVSEIVYNKVVTQGGNWLDRAFVVTDWYLTAYEPICDVDGVIIGILYVGILEKPFIDLQVRISLMALMIIMIAGVLAMFFAYFLVSIISKPIDKTLEATAKISDGHLLHRIDVRTSIWEFNQLVCAFNEMAGKIDEREKSITVSKERIEELNKQYLDLVGFVSHELKGILSSVVLNTYLLQKGVLGVVNEAQQKTLRSISRNLDYLTATVKNFLNLSRIEKGELKLHFSEFSLKEHVFDIATEAFLQQAEEKKITIINEIDSAIRIVGDVGLLQIVANNLLGNAIKYGAAQGTIRLSSKMIGDMLEVEVYNDGKPIADIDVDKLFKKFSRLVYEGMEKIKGTGVGLFITKEIVHQHNGTIWVEPRVRGNSFKFTIKK